MGWYNRALFRTSVRTCLLNRDRVDHSVSPLVHNLQDSMNDITLEGVQRRALATSVGNWNDWTPSFILAVQCIVSIRKSCFVGLAVLRLNVLFRCRSTPSNHSKFSPFSTDLHNMTHGYRTSAYWGIVLTIASPMETSLWAYECVRNDEIPAYQDFGVQGTLT